MVLRITSTALDLIFPPRCSKCDGCKELSDPGFCRTCWETITTDRALPACPRCASTVAPGATAADRCRACRKRESHYRAVVRIGDYRSSIGELLRAFKYDRHEELAPMLGQWLHDSLISTPWYERIQAVVPVPTLWRRRLSRSFYPADFLANVVARKLHRPLVPLLRRIKGGRHQIGLSYTERVRNVRGAFAVRRGTELDRARILLIDDVKTTGATLNECARILRRAGAEEVYAGTVATVNWNEQTGHGLHNA